MPDAPQLDPAALSLAGGQRIDVPLLEADARTEDPLKRCTTGWRGWEAILVSCVRLRWTRCFWRSLFRLHELGQ